jgi:hypothetical protein
VGGGTLAAAYVIDSNPNSAWQSNPGLARPYNAVTGQWVKVDLGSAKDITYLRYNGGGPASWLATFQSSTDNSTWTDRQVIDLGGVDHFDTGYLQIGGGPITARYWRLILTTGPSPDDGSVFYTFGAYTLYVYSGEPLVQAPGHQIEDEGSPLLQRSVMNFVGDGVTAADSGGKTVVTIDGAIRKNLVDAKGDLLAGTADNTVARLPVGMDGQIPYADATAPTGLRWGAPPSSVPSSAGTYLVSGGQVTWQTGYTYAVAAGTGYVNGVLVAWVAQTVTLAAADPTDDRIDVIYVDDAATADSITGTPAANPSEPVTDPATQLKLALVTVGAGTTEPTVTSELLYAEDAGSGGVPAEWDWTTSGTGWTVASTSNPRTGTTAIEGTAVAANAYVQGQRGSGTIDPTAFGQLVLYLRFKAAWGANLTLQVTLRNNGIQVGNAMTVASGTFGLSSANTTTYQAVIIPTLQFATPAHSLIDQVRIQAVGTGGAAIGCYLDDLTFTSGGAVVVGAAGISEDEADARYLRRANNLNDVNDPATARTNLAIEHGNLPDVDTDAGASSIHHTLGTGADQAAAGDHTHSFSTTDEKAKVSSNDTTPGYLNGKLVAGTNITLTEVNDGANETLTIAATAGSSAVSVTQLHEHVANEDHTAETNGSKTTFILAQEFAPETSAVYQAGLRLRLGTDYTEAATCDAVTLTSAPSSSTALAIDYITA